MTALPFSTSSAATPVHILRGGAWRAWAEQQPEAVTRLAAAQDFRAQAGRTFHALTDSGALIVFGVAEAATPMALGALASSLAEGDYTLAEAPEDWDRTYCAIAWALGAYAFERYKPRKRGPARLVPPADADMDEAALIARAAYLARDLVNTPTNDMGPDALNAEARRVAADGGATLTAIVGDSLLELNYPLIHAVGRAASEAPRLLHIAWGEDDHPRVAIVGKGVTFDTGGLDIKSAGGMRLMKKDMGGSAHALALTQMIMEAKLPVRLDTFIPVAENAISGNAFRPGDVITSRKGLSVEIDNTDAEGRLILADALARASEDAPELLFNFATLTGAARVALGPDLPPFYTPNDALASELNAASEASFDPIWRLPLWDPYDGEMDSPIADLKNGGDAGFAGSIYAALFLRKFIEAKSWAHFDVYAWAPKEKPARPKGGEAQALRACWGVLKKRYAS